MPPGGETTVKNTQLRRAVAVSLSPSHLIQPHSTEALDQSYTTDGLRGFRFARPEGQAGSRVGPPAVQAAGGAGGPYGASL